MTGYIAAAARGREAAHETNTSYKMRILVEYREEQVPGQKWVPAVPPFPGRFEDDPEHPATVGKLIGNCGHTIEYRQWPPQWMEDLVGKRRRCRECPAGPPRPPTGSPSTPTAPPRTFLAVAELPIPRLYTYQGAI